MYARLKDLITGPIPSLYAKLVIGDENNSLEVFIDDNIGGLVSNS